MKPTPSRSPWRVTAGAAALLLAMLALLGLAAAPASEADQPQAQVTGLFNPNIGGVLRLQPTATPAPFDASDIFLEPGVGVLPIFTLPPILTFPTPIPTPPPCGQAITLGKTVNGQLKGGGQQCQYTFRGATGQTIDVTMRRTGGAIDPLIELIGPSSVRVAMDDDSDGRLNAALRGYTLNEDGFYTVIARSFDPTASGAFKLSVNSVRPSQPDANLPGPEDALCFGTALYGQPVQGQAPFPGAECRYTFDGGRGDVVALHLRALEGGALPDVWLQNASGRALPGELVVSEEGSVTSGLTLPANGRYTVVLSDNSDAGTGPFELTVVRQNPCKEVLVGALRGEVSPFSSACTYLLRDRPTMFTNVAVKPLGDDLQPLVTFYGPNGELLDQYVSDGTARAVPGNTWTMSVQGADGSSGLFEVRLSGAQFLISEDFCGGEMTSGKFIRGEVTSFLPSCRYTFDGEAGDVVTIRMTRQGGTTNDLDTFLTLLDPAATPEATDDDGGLPPTNSLIKEHELQTSGEYTLEAGAYNDASDGPFYLTFWLRSP